MNSKPWYLSKTFWVNLLSPLLMFIPVVGDYIKGHPDVWISVFAALNLVLRLVTKGSLQIGD